jgi:hypothetical protein
MSYEHIKFLGLAFFLTAPSLATAANLPITQGNYAHGDDPCQYEYFVQYKSQIEYDGANLDSSTRSRKILSIAEDEPGMYNVELEVEGTGLADDTQPKTTVHWLLKAVDDKGFLVIPDKREWEGKAQLYHYCGPVEHILATVPPLGSNGDPTKQSKLNAAGQATAAPPPAPKPTKAVLNYAPAEIGDEIGDPYEHNGSTMWLYRRKGLIVYNVPKASLQGTVQSGAVVFRGKFTKAGAEGTAYTFKKGCNPAPYAAIGRFSGPRNETLVIEGASPVRDKNSCVILGYDSNSPNARLRFTPGGMMLE